MTAIDDCVAAVRETFDAVFERIDDWRSRIETLVAEANGALSSAEVDALTESLVYPELSAPGAIVIGAGFVASPRFLADTDWHLAWWLGHANTFGVGSAKPGVRRLVAVEDETSANFRDYTNLEWWRVPARTGERHITGPYVDYLCTDDYTLTLTMPASHSRSQFGVVGADLYVSDIERILLPFVRAIERSATIVNSAGRVVVSTDPHRATGSLLRTEQTDEETLECGDTGLQLVLHDRL
jgi:hypothetical protein